MKQAVIGAGFSLIAGMGLHKLAIGGLRGLGGILMFHRVKPEDSDPFRPNALLEITPQFLDALLGHLHEKGYDIVSLDEALVRCHAPVGAAPFAVLTFDDGFRDVVDHALPVLERHGAPFTVFATPGFADRTARLWWVELEESIRRLDGIEFSIGRDAFHFSARNARDKQAAFRLIYAHLRRGSEENLLAAVEQLRDRAGLTSAGIASDLCLDWDGIVSLSRHPLAAIGAHTMTHPRLAKLSEPDMLWEMAESRREIEKRIGCDVRHIAFPVGDTTSAGQREFEAARKLGFTAAVTTRPGLIFPEHADHLTALPRLSVNGNWQSLTNLDVLLSGTAYALWNRGRRVNAA